MTKQYFEIAGKRYRFLLQDEERAWLIGSEGTSGPIIISCDELSFLKPLLPEQPCIHSLSSFQTRVRDERYETIGAMDNNKYIVDREAREQLISEIAHKEGKTKRTIRNWYYRFLFHGKNGLAPRQKQKTSNIRYADEMMKALRKYHFSSKQLNLTETYHKMLEQYFCDGNGQIVSDHPSLSQFRYYYQHQAKDEVKKIISQDGIYLYKKEYRPLYGCARNISEERIGVYQLDATLTDVYVVSRFNRHVLLGRPYLYLVSDTYSGLICGAYVGFDKSRCAVLESLRVAAISKEERASMLKEMGINISPDDWPCRGLPRVIITDNGTEFLSNEVKALVEEYGLILTSLPSYRPDLKGTVESAIRQTQQEYKSSLHGYGAVFKGQSSFDYVKEAVLTLEEFRKVVFISLVRINKSRILDSFLRPRAAAEKEIPAIPARIWEWCYQEYEKKGQYLTIPIHTKDELVLLAIDQGRFTRYGLQFRHCYYKNESFNDRCTRAGITKTQDVVTIAYSASTANYVYLVENGQYVRFELTPRSEFFIDSTHEDIDAFLASERRAKKKLEKEVHQGIIDRNYAINAIIEHAKEGKK